MALGELTKQLAKQALSNQVGEILDPAKPPKPAGPENLGLTIAGQIQAMQKACKDDQELAAFCQAGSESVRIVEVYVPSPQLLVLTGFDSNHNLTRIVSPVSAAQIVCKIVKAQAGAAPQRINFIAPKPKAE